MDFGDGEVVGNSSVFLVSYRASDGAHQWSNTYTSSEASGNYAYDLAVDTAGDVAVTGQFWGDINFGGGLANGADVGQWPLAGAIEPSIAASANGNLIAAGRFDPSLDVDSTNFTTAGGFDGFLVQSDPR